MTDFIKGFTAIINKEFIGFLCGVLLTAFMLSVIVGTFTYLFACFFH